MKACRDGGLRRVRTGPWPERSAARTKKAVASILGGADDLPPGYPVLAVGKVLVIPRALRLLLRLPWMHPALADAGFRPDLVAGARRRCCALLPMDLSPWMPGRDISIRRQRGSICGSKSEQRHRCCRRNMCLSKWPGDDIGSPRATLPHGQGDFGVA